MVVAGAGSTTSEAQHSPARGAGTDYGEWIVARVDDPASFDNTILGGYSCSCNGRTLLQINRAADIHAPLQIGLTCRADGNRNFAAYQRMPWGLHQSMVRSERWQCDRCDSEIGTIHKFDGRIVGVAVSCPLCDVRHVIDLTLSQLPPELRRSAFGIEPPAVLISPPMYDLLQRMWDCTQKQPTNTFIYVPYEVRERCGLLHHASTGEQIEAPLDLLEGLSYAGLVDDEDFLSISQAGVIVCLQKFGRATG